MSRLVVTLAVDNAAPGKAIGIKEAVAMDLEKYGDVRVLRVEVQAEEQMSLGGKSAWKSTKSSKRPTKTP